MNLNGLGYRPVERVPLLEPTNRGRGNAGRRNENAPSRAILARDGVGLLGWSMPRPHNDSTRVTRTGGGESDPADQATSYRRRSIHGRQGVSAVVVVVRGRTVGGHPPRAGRSVSSVRIDREWESESGNKVLRGRTNFASSDDHSGYPGRSDSSVRWAVTYREIRWRQRKSWDRLVSPSGCRNYRNHKGLRHAASMTPESSSRKSTIFPPLAEVTLSRLTCCPIKA